MPQVTHLDDQEEAEWTGQADDDWSYPLDGNMNSWNQAWAVAGFITWRHNHQDLLSVPFVYHPTPFLPGATTVSHYGATADPATSRGLRTATLPSLPLGDEWVMADHYWRHELLGWMEARDIPGGREGKSPCEPVGVSATTIEVANLLPDPEDVDNKDLLCHVYRQFRPAGLIRDLWVPVGQKDAERLKVVVVFGVDDAVGRALAMPFKQYFIDNISHVISVNRYYPVWYPAPRSQVPALEAYAVNTRTTSINALMWHDRELSNIETDYFLPSINPPDCRPFTEMPDYEKDRLRTYFGFNTLEPIRLSSRTAIDRYIPPPSPPGSSVPLPPPASSGGTLLEQVVRPPSPPPTEPGSTTSSPQRSTTIDKIDRDRRGLPIRGMPSTKVRIKPLDSSPKTADSVSIGADKTEDGPRTKKLRFEDETPSDSHKQHDSNDMTKRKYLDDIVKAQIHLTQISARLTTGDGSRNGRLHIKRKSGELDDDDDNEDNSDMDMDIDD